MSWNSGTNRISIKWFNHNRWIDIFFIKENYLFVHIFNISPCGFTQISIGRDRWMRNLIPNPTSTHTAYFWQTPLPQKQEILEKMWSWCRGVHQKYAVWVLVWCEIKFLIQWSLPLEIWVKTQGDMSKIWTQKVVFSFFL